MTASWFELWRLYAGYDKIIDQCFSVADELILKKVALYKH